MKPAALLVILLSMALSAGADPAPPAPGQIFVQTQPDGAAVEVDGEKRGTTPVTVDNLAPGDHLVRIRKSGFEDAIQTVTLAQGERSPLDLRLIPLQGLVLFITDPPGADVEVNGANRGKTPMFARDIPFGSHRIRLALEGYQAKELDLMLQDRAPVKIEEKLLSTTAALVINSEPSGVRVLVNGMDRGTTPATIAGVAAGQARVELVAEGFEPYSATVPLRAGDQETVNAVLKPLPSMLRVVSIPDKARIYVDNQFRGTTPLELPNLQPGAYRVRAELDGYARAARSITLDKAAQITEEFRLVSNSGILDLITVPAGVSVVINGKEVGVTQSDPKADSPMSLPLRLRLTADVEQSLTLSRQGFNSRTVRVTLTKDTTRELRETLLRKFEPDTEVITTTGKVRGVLARKEPNGDVILEVRAGIFLTFPAKDVRLVRPISEAE